mgnify:CR=1 FL=1
MEYTYIDRIKQIKSEKKITNDQLSDMTGIPLGTPGDILSSGLILPLNICVGLVVACTMYAFYAMFRKGGF